MIQDISNNHVLMKDASMTYTIRANTKHGERYWTGQEWSENLIFGVRYNSYDQAISDGADLLDRDQLERIDPKATIDAPAVTRQDVAKAWVDYRQPEIAVGVLALATAPVAITLAWMVFGQILAQVGSIPAS